MPTDIRWEFTSAGGRWFAMDSSLVQRFRLVRTANCKCAAVIGRESLFRGTPEHPAYAGGLFGGWLFPAHRGSANAGHWLPG